MAADSGALRQSGLHPQGLPSANTGPPPSGLKVSSLPPAPSAMAAGAGRGQPSWGKAVGITALTMLVIAWQRWVAPE